MKETAQPLIKHKKSLGQNFLSDKNLLRAMVNDASVNAGDVVVEIGAGAGALTSALCEKGARVISFEIDKSLKDILTGNDELKSVEFVFKDILSVTHGELKDITGGNFKVVANLPYYITTPVIFYFLESDLKIDSLTVMVQKEVALRVTAKPSTPDYGALSLTIAARAEAKITRSVSRNMFTPPPNVDSAIVHMQIKSGYDPLLTKLLRSGFLMRRKTLLNNLTAAYSLSRENALSVLKSAGISENARAEQLRLQDFINLYKIMGQTP